jgi:hypothetical protein
MVTNPVVLTQSDLEGADRDRQVGLCQQQCNLFCRTGPPDGV